MSEILFLFHCKKKINTRQESGRIVDHRAPPRHQAHHKTLKKNYLIDNES